jgi:hypothetical protein
LQSESGPDDWQQDILTTIAEGLSPQRALQIAVASGHGPGKTALVAWIILWAMLTEADTRGVVTANTESQLRTKTWADDDLSPFWGPKRTWTSHYRRITIYEYAR